MANSPARDENKKPAISTMTIPQLLTPEEPLQESFERSAPKPSIPVSVLSPPTSPEFSSFSTETRFQQNDHVLYPDDTDAEPYRPLFENTRSMTPEVQLTQQMNESPSISKSPSDHVNHIEQDPIAESEPTQPQAEGSRQCVHPVDMYNRDPQGYYNDCMAQLDKIRLAKGANVERILPTPVRSRVVIRDRKTQDQVSSLGRSFKVDKNTRATVQISKSKAAIVVSATVPAMVAASPVVPKSESQTKRRRRQTTTPDASFGSYPHAVAPKPRTRAPPSKAIDNKDNSEWYDIVDKSPPIASLDDMSRPLEAHWHNNNKINLDADPDRHHLHPQELEVAAVLRLKCNAYLANKRRIFAAKVQALQDHKEFNKTSAQTCTNIDVNKASRLWDSFHKVGWFDEKWFTKWIN